MKVNSITVKVKLFAIYQEVYQQEEISFDLPQASKVQNILDMMIRDYPELTSWLSVSKLAVNLDFISPDFILSDGDEVALIPPVSGGKY